MIEDENKSHKEVYKKSLRLTSEQIVSAPKQFLNYFHP